MRRKSVFLMVLLTFLVASSFATLEVQSVKASGTIYIRADGSIDPSTAPIQRNGDVYNLTGNITSDADGIVVERENIVIDGSGFAIEGPGAERARNVDGIYLLRKDYVTIQNMNVKNFTCGIVLYTSSFNRIYKNNITNNSYGILLVYDSTGNNINENSIVNNVYGIDFGSSLVSNTIYHNTIANNSQGISLGYYVSTNSIGGNLIANNSEGIGLDSASSNDISGNNITGNGGGIVLRYDSNSNSISRNVIKGNGEGIGIHDSSTNNHVRQNAFINDSLYVQYPYPNSVENNTVNGRPLVYLESVRDYSVEDAGQVILVRCNRIRVEGLDLSRTSTGLQLWETNNCIFSGNTITMNRRCGIELFSSSNNSITQNTIANSGDGIWLDSSSNNRISGNTIANNTYEGIWLDSSSNNRINGNTITNNSDYGTWLNSSSNNSMRGNNIINNYVGVLLRYSSNNSINGNTMTDNGDGIWLAYSSRYNSIDGNLITNNSEGILLDSSSNNNISGNTVADNWEGVFLSSSSSYNSIDRNTITNNGWYGIGLDSASSNSISGNTIAKNNYGILLGYSSGNAVCHNNFIDKTGPVNNLTPTYSNFWDNCCEGNYWSDYNGTDANHDGIGDTPYVIDANNTDNYPLMGTFYEFTVTDGMLYNITTVSNFTILDLYSLHELRIDGSWYLVLEFTAVVPKGTVGFCRIVIPRVLIDGPYHVFTLGGNFTPTELPISNSSHAFLYFTFDHSGPVIIVPEFPSFLILPLFFTVTLLAVIAYRRKHR